MNDKESIEVSELLAYTNNALGIVMLRATVLNEIDTNTAILFFQESLRIYKKLERSDTIHNIANVFNNIGQAYYTIGQYDWATKSFEISMKIRQHMRDQCTSINLGYVMLHLGKAYQKLGKLDESIKVFQDFLDLLETKMKHENVKQDIAFAATCLASIHIEKGNIKSARQSYEFALPATISIYGIVSIEVASIVNKLATICYKLGNMDDSLMYLTQGLEIEKMVYGLNHDNIVVTLLNIAQIQRDQGDYAKAFLHYKQVHNIQACKKGPDAFCVSSTLYSMGLMMYRMKVYSTSFKYYQKALFIQRKHIGDDIDHEDIAASLNSIGIVLFHWGKHQIAKSFFEESLCMRRKLFGSNHPDVSVNLFNLATLHLELGDDETAIALYQETLKVERQIKSASGPDILQTLQYLGSLYHSRGELDESLSYFKEALELERSKKGSNHLCVGKILNLIGNIYLQRGIVDKMMDAFSEATRIYNLHNESLVIVGFNLYGISKLHPECAEVA